MSDRVTQPFRAFRNPRVRTAEKTCDACPEQYEGWLEGGLAFYFRLRGGWASLGVGSTVDLACEDSMIANVSVELQVDQDPRPPAGISFMGAFETDEQRDEVFDVMLAERLRRLQPLELPVPPTSDEPLQLRAMRAALSIVARIATVSRSRAGHLPPQGELDRAERLVTEALAVALVKLPTFAGDIVVHALTAARGLLDEDSPRGDGKLSSRMLAIERARERMPSLESETVSLIDQALGQVKSRGHLTLAGEIAAMNAEERDRVDERSPLEERLGCRVREAIDAGLILRMLAARSRVRTLDQTTLDKLVSLSNGDVLRTLWDWTWPPKLDDHARIQVGIATELAEQSGADVAADRVEVTVDSSRAGRDLDAAAFTLGITRKVFDLLMSDPAGKFKAGAAKRETLLLLLQNLEAAASLVVEDADSYFDEEGKFSAQSDWGIMREGMPVLLARAKGVRTLAADVRVAAQDLATFAQVAEHVAGDPEVLNRLVDVAERTAVHFLDTDAPLGRAAFLAFKGVGAENAVLDQSYAAARSS